MLPSLIVSTTVVVLTSADGEESFEAVAIFLNVVAVCFICDVDNLMGKFLVNTRLHPRHDQALEELKNHETLELSSPIRWFDNRLFALALSIAMGMESMYMTELILALNPLFGEGFLNLGNSRLDRARNRIGVANDANCNKVIFAIQAMTLFRAAFGCLLDFTFDVWRTITMRNNLRYSRAKLSRRLLLHTGLFVFALVINYGVYRAVLEIMRTLRGSGRAFKCNWEGCEELYAVAP